MGSDLGMQQTINSPAKTKTMSEFSRDEVAKQKEWIIIDSKVYDIAKFRDGHPGGSQVFDEYAGQDATEVFYSLHKHEIITGKFGPRLMVGSIKGETSKIAAANKWSDLSTVPFGETPHFQRGFKPTPYYNETHESFKLGCRAVIERELREVSELGENSGKMPSHDIWKMMGREGLLASRIGVACMNQLPAGITLPGGLAPNQFDYFHELIAHEEIARLATPGYNDGLGAGFWIGLPPVIKFASPMVRDHITPQVLLGNKRICLSITEPYTGSDVAGIKTTATKSEDGTHYIIKGVKKWITNGEFADYFVTAVRTGGKGMKGISMIVVERTDDLSTKHITAAYSKSAGTSLVMYESVEVPVENLLGEENKGFSIIMANFNHERWIILLTVQQYSRNCLLDSVKWLNQRQAFNKSLTQQPVLRYKLGQAAAAVESCHAWLEQVTYQMNSMSYEEQNLKLGGTIALLKYETTRCATLVCDNCVQLLGGRGVTRHGMGKTIQRFNNAYKIFSVYGGSEEIMADLGVRQALRNMDPLAKL